MLLQAHITDSLETARQMLLKVIENHQAFDVFCQMVKAQGGQDNYIRHPELFDTAKEVIEVKAGQAGYIKDLKAKAIGLASMQLGGGRRTKDDYIDYSVGLILNKKIGDYVAQDETLVYVHTNNGLSEELKNQIRNAYTIVEDYVKKPVFQDEVFQ